MLITRDKNEQNRVKMVVGIDLGRYAVQISFMKPGMNAPETAEQVSGSEVFNIPMLLCKRTGVNQWFYGREALRYYEKNGGCLVDGILQKAIDGENVDVEGKSIEGIALLTLFIKRSLSVLGGARIGEISDIMFTCEELGTKVVDVMCKVAANLQLKTCNIYFQSYAESIYNYMIHQDPDIWLHDVFLAFFNGKYLVNYRFRRNLRTTPIVTFVEESEKIEMSLPENLSEEWEKEAYRRLDEQFFSLMRDSLGCDLISGVYLLGDGFKDDWADQSLKYLGRNRRLFIGNDLFSRGACYCLMDKYEPIESAKSHIFLGPDKLKSNIGLNVLRQGQDSYLAILDAGLNWYEAKAEYELFMPEDWTLHLVVIPLDNGKHMEQVITLDNPPDRDPDTLRVRINVAMKNVETLSLHIEDLGFGTLFPSSGQEWDYEIEL